MAFLCTGMHQQTPLAPYYKTGTFINTNHYFHSSQQWGLSHCIHRSLWLSLESCLTPASLISHYYPWESQPSIHQMDRWLRIVHPFMVCRTRNRWGGLCVYQQFLKISPLLSGFSLQPVQRWIEQFWSGALPQNEAADISSCGLLQPTAVRCTPAARGASAGGRRGLGFPSLWFTPIRGSIFMPCDPSSERDVPFKDDEATAL